MNLISLRSLGRSGLLVSPLALGTMTMGTPRWGSPEDVSEAIFNHYVDAGGNFLDTADVYSKGRSEELLGGFIEARKLRDRLVLATKYSFGADATNPLAGGNSRKNLHRALEGSLRRLRTDYVDLFWMHVWDRVTPVEEVLQAMGELVQAGKIRYFGLSDVPAWYTARMSTLAAAHNVPGPIALQMAYSLVEREIEREHIPAARQLGIGLTPWSPLAAGFLTGKYTPDDQGQGNPGGGRLDVVASHRRYSVRNWTILAALREVSEETGRTMAQVALAWALAQTGVSSLLLGATKVEQLEANLASLEVTLTAEHMTKLENVSALEPGNPYALFSEPVNRMIFAGVAVKGWS